MYKSFTLCFSYICFFLLSTFNIQILKQKELKTNMIHKKIMSYRCSQFSSSNLNFMLPLRKTLQGNLFHGLEENLNKTSLNHSRNVSPFCHFLFIGFLLIYSSKMNVYVFYIQNNRQHDNILNTLIHEEKMSETLWSNNLGS